MKIIGVIPSRYCSTRFPGKPLADICGKPMIWWVYQQVKKINAFNKVVNNASTLIASTRITTSNDLDLKKVCYNVSQNLGNKDVTLEDLGFNDNATLGDIAGACIMLMRLYGAIVTAQNEGKEVYNKELKKLDLGVGIDLSTRLQMQ